MFSSMLRIHQLNPDPRNIKGIELLLVKKDCFHFFGDIFLQWMLKLLRDLFFFNSKIIFLRMGSTFCVSPNLPWWVGMSCSFLHFYLFLIFSSVITYLIGPEPLSQWLMWRAEYVGNANTFRLVAHFYYP